LKTPISSSTRKTIDKAMQVMTAFTQDRPELAVSELAERLGIHKSVISRIASSLKAWDMLETNSVTGRLRVGPGAFRIGSLFSHRPNSLADVAGPLLADLVAQTGHSAHLSVCKDEHILVVATVESPSALRVIMRVGDERQLHTTAAGKLFMALSAPSLMRAAYRESQFKALTPLTVKTMAEMERNLARIRRERVAHNQGENTLGAGAVAAPVMSRSGEVIAVVSTVFPLHVVDAEKRTLIEGNTRACAEQLSIKVARLPSRSFA
jgi:IclR family KDG regulon transcriptional repressor